jgi:hypothetical protein
MLKIMLRNREEKRKQLVNVLISQHKNFVNARSTAIGIILSFRCLSCLKDFTVQYSNYKHRKKGLTLCITCWQKKQASQYVIPLQEAVRVERIAGKNRTRTVYIFLCKNCKKELRVDSSHLKRHTGICNSCHRKKRPYEVIYKRLLLNATAKHIPVDITYEDFLNFTQIPNCHYCDEPIFWCKFTSKHNYGTSYNLDRIDNKKGYILNNCVVCCTFCNYVKKDQFSYQEFLLLIPVLKQIKKNRLEKI